MRLLTGADIIDFYNGRDDLLALSSDGTYTTVDYDDIADGDTTAYAYVIAEDGAALRILLERTTINEGEWFPDALTESGDLDPSAADEMASIINNDADLATAIAVREIRQATLDWQVSAAETNQRAARRAALVAAFAERCGSQSAAARLLGLDQSTVNKLVRKASEQ
jgi:hypothetical protein